MTERTQSGAVLVEAALALIMVFVLAFGAIDGALLLEHKNDLSDASRGAARVGVTSLPKITEDYYILQTIRQDRSLMNAGTIKQVIVFKSTSTSGTVPAGCEVGSVAGLCNVYTNADLKKAKSDIDALQTSWPPSSRGGDDFLGVQILSSHSAMSGLIPWPVEIRDKVIMRIEPNGINSSPAWIATPNSAYTPTTYPQPGPLGNCNPCRGAVTPGDNS